MERYAHPADDPSLRQAESHVQALMVCNGRFVSNRSLDLIYAQELKLNLMPVLPPWEIEVDEERRTVAVGVAANDPVPTMRAVYRDGFGCMVLAPDQNFDDIASLPIFDMPGPEDGSKLSWPTGDLHPEIELSDRIDALRLEAALGEGADPVRRRGLGFRIPGAQHLLDARDCREVVRDFVQQGRA